MWHVSIALVRDIKGCKPLHAWSARDRRDAIELARSILAGVGSGPLDVKDGERALHLRRRLSTEEMGYLSHEWLALPAIDPGHPDDDGKED